MARKEDKLRPYRVVYFDIVDMKENDLALVRSVVVRAVTYDVASELVLHNAPADRIIIRCYRFYKKLVAKKDVFKAVEDLFSENQAIKIMETVEGYRAAKAATAALASGTITNLKIG